MLRASLGCATTLNFFTFIASGGLIVLFAGRTLGLSAGAIGLAFGVGATGALLGAVPAPKVSRWIGVGRSIAVIGGLLATLIGLRATLLIAAIGGVSSLLWLLPSPIPRVRSLAPDGRDGDGLAPGDAGA